MIRVVFFAAVLALFALASVASAKIEVAPMPREAGQLEPVAESPAEVVERIVRHAKSAGERLAQRDPGNDTRKTQADILRDIDALLNPPPQPPMKNDSNDQKNPNPPPMSDSNSKSKSGNEAKGDNEPKGGKNSGTSRPSAGLPSQSENPSQAAGPRPRVYRNKPMPENEPQPSEETTARAKPMEKKIQPMGKGSNEAADAGNGGQAAPKASMPLDGDVVKEVWGHLPEQLRQQVSEYYKQQFMPQYADLLRQYYLSLAERDRKSMREPNR